MLPFITLKCKGVRPSMLYSFILLISLFNICDIFSRLFFSISSNNSLLYVILMSDENNEFFESDFD